MTRAAPPPPAAPRRGLDEAAAERLVVGAVERPSPSGAEEEVVRYLRDAVAPWSDRAEVDAAGNLTATFGSGPRRVVLLGHADTAPGDWPVEVRGRQLHGRGAVDAKGSLCAFLVAATRLDDRQRERLTVQVIGAVEEEAASSRGARHALEAYRAPDMVVVGEPSGWDAITLGYKGRLALRVRLERPEGHSARHEASAAEQVVTAWQRVQRWASGLSAREASAFDAVHATLLDVRSESDGLTQRAHATIALRLPPAWPPERSLDALRRVLAASLASPGATLDVVSAEAAHRSGRDGTLQRALRTAIRSEGGRPRHLVKTGTSDMNVVAPVWRVPVVAYGPGDASLDHTPDERLDLDEYARSVRVLERALHSLAADAANVGVTAQTGRSSS